MKDLQELAASAPYDVVKCINESEGSFLAAFKHDRNCQRPLVLKHLIKILHSLTISEETHLAARILGQILSKDGEFAIFVFHLDQLLKNMPLETRQHIRYENQHYLGYLLSIGLFAIEHVPGAIINTFPRVPLDGAIVDLIRQGEPLEKLKKDLEELNERFETAREELRRVPVANEADQSPEQGEPPEPFTDMTILPASHELESAATWKPFLRPNVTKGAYRDWNHYLDVQFRLLREDFIAPLRKGIDGHYQGLTGRKLPEIRVYNHVRILAPVCLFTGMGFQVHFDTQSLGRVNWEHSRRLIFGSLLCLSQDNFNTIFFATVTKRDPKLLKDGHLTIKFEGDVDGFIFDPSEEFTMAESTAYFEAYRHVLEGLKRVSNSSATMPFKQCIVDCQVEVISSPSYIRGVAFNLCEVLGLKSGRKPILITDISVWPHADETTLDKSQLKAVQMALSQEISVIQGPPGTGKTHVGLKIVQAFLQNRQAWDPLRNSPILVVCYTNHALDQFLEGIHDCQVDGKPPSIVRIGGRCKSEKLSTCVLSEKVKACRSERSVPSRVHRRLIDTRNGLFHMKKEIDQVLEQVNASEGKIISLSVLESAIPEHHVIQIKHGMRTDVGKELEVWLGLWYPQEAPGDTVQSDEGYFGPPEPNQPGQQQANEVAAQSDDSDDDELFIQVDNEPQLLQEERLLEGEEIELVDQQEQQEAALPGRSPGATSVDPGGWRVVQMSEGKRKKKIERGFRYNPMKARRVHQIEDVRNLSEKERWQLYHYWVNEYLKQRKRQIAAIAERYNACCELYNDAQQALNVHVLREADVIGMTTTGAAKHSYVLHDIYPKIVVIEEAAEVFESHIVTSVSPSVQQLILIGDHKQLKPKPNHFDLEKNYGLAVSLFERLIMNKIDHSTLQVQHRMRPEIADLLRPHIYESLSDHESVLGREDVAGVGKNVFFIDHAQPEEANRDGDSKSHSNIHEVTFLVALCRYLLKQGYTPSQITILTMYRGQLLEIKKRMRRDDFDGVRVAAVDDFQGEENDIILLSLVRSNSEGIIGFLGIENRVCVSLSRAKIGMYVIGNLKMLRDKHKTIWPNIVLDMDQKQCTGPALPLYCQVHPDQKVFAKTAEDFSKCPEGGCQKPCGRRLQCGHVCTRLCHPYDMDHKFYKCHRTCTKMLGCGHPCTHKCYECKAGCLPCTTTVLKTMPKCGHKMNLPCPQDPAKVKCKMLCSNLLRCGHLCQESCSQPCTAKCMVPVEKTLPCGDKMEICCYQKPEDIECPKPCRAHLDCDHGCSGTCGSCHRGRLHMQCKHKCDRTLVCGHICCYPCTPNCPPCVQACKNYCNHSRCPRKCYEPCDPCMEPCLWNCPHFQCSKRCGEMCDRPPCNQPCIKQLKCGHPCIGLCGEECPNLCLICDSPPDICLGSEEDEGAMFIELKDCRHVFEVSDLDRWMELETEEVQLKGCPRCKTSVRKSLRYSNIIKTTLRDFEEIKRKQMTVSADVNDVLTKFRKVEQESSQSPHAANAHVVSDLDKIRSAIMPRQGTHMDAKVYLPPHAINTAHVQLAVISGILSVHKTLGAIQTRSCRFPSCTVQVANIRRDANILQKVVMQGAVFLSDQQVADVHCELRRLTSVTRLCDLQYKVENTKCQVSTSDQGRLGALACQVLRSGLDDDPKMTEQTEWEVSDLIAHFNRQYSVNGLSDAERTEIVEAIGLTRGHWFKCPNGHFYCIGDCGGAMERANCPECDAVIGGAAHQLAEGNQLAPEMDGAQYAAWSEHANLLNYDPAELDRLGIF